MAFVETASSMLHTGNQGLVLHTTCFHSLQFTWDVTRVTTLEFLKSDALLQALGLPRSYAIIGSVLVPIMMANGIRWCVATTDCGMCNGRLQCVPCNDSLESSRIFGRVSACIFEHMTAPAIPTDLSSPTSTGVKHGFPC